MATLGGKIAWITGAGSGIGLAGAMALAKAGAQVVLSGRRSQPLDQAVAEIKATGGSAEAAPLDVADSVAVGRVAEDILARHGRVDILVNSAGLNLPQRRWADMGTEGWDQVIAINLNGTRYCIAAVLPAMRTQQEGLVINVSSWAGRFVSGLTGAAYTASKHGVVALTMSLNMEECQNGIRATALCPGEVATPILRNRPKPPPPEDIARMLQAEDMGRTILFLAETPPHVCFNEILVAPTWNRIFLGIAETGRQP